MSDVKVVEVLLRDASGWSDWFCTLQARATVADIWDHVDPDKPDGPVLREPELSVAEDTTTFDKATTDKLILYELLPTKHVSKREPPIEAWATGCSRRLNSRGTSCVWT